MAEKILGHVDPHKPAMAAILRGAVKQGLKKGWSPEEIVKTTGLGKDYALYKKFEREAREEMRREKKRKR